MTRTLCILTGLVLLLSPLASDQFGLGTEAYQRELISSLGGNTSRAKANKHCDGYGGGGGSGYLACTGVGANCRQCLVTGADGSLQAATFEVAIYTHITQIPGYRTEKENGPAFCGYVFTGHCIKTPNATAGGYTCVGTLGTTQCSYQYPVVKQPTRRSGS